VAGSGTLSLFPRRVFTVTELLALVRGELESGVGRVWVAGEVSNLRQPGSGHVYLTLKDRGGQVRAALFRQHARRLRFALEDGLEVIVHGEVTVYEARGDLQIIVREVEPRGLGALQLAFEQLRARLEAEGLFDDARKRALPAYPRRVGVVTSPTGAAIRDVIEVTGRRFPAAPLLVAPARVQGDDAEEEIVAALELVALQPEVDVVLLVRGGGSLEDLLAFNSESVARAIRACPIPVVCGVGHEVDVSIADLAADARAPTPSAAAALALPDRSALAAQLQRDRGRLARALERILERAAARFARSSDALHAQAPARRLAATRERLERALTALIRSARLAVRDGGARLAANAARLEALSPVAVLARGYAIVRHGDQGSVVRAAEQVAVGDALAIRLGSGEIDAAVTGVRRAPEREKS
jgi:exodeoxyribonuclease VII large subunit